MRPTDAIPHPPDWSTATIAKSVEVRRGVSWSKEQEHHEPGEGRIPVIGIGNVQSDLEVEDIIYLSGLKPAAVERAAYRRDGRSWSDPMAIAHGSATPS